MRVFLFVFSFFSWIVSAQAHQFLPTVAELRLVSEGEYVLRINLDIIEMMQNELELETQEEALIAQVRQLPMETLETALTRLRSKFSQGITLQFDDQTVPIQNFMLPPASYVKQVLRGNPIITEYRVLGMSRGPIPGAIQTVAVKFPEVLGNVRLTIVSPKTAIVPPGLSSPLYRFGETASQTSLYEIATYLYQGFLHIIPKGWDHILFVLALFLLSNNLRILLWQVTLFTVAHSITLILAAYEWVNVPAEIVEPLIALSIVFVAAENLFHQQLKPWRLALIFGFGLLHGLGFASVFLELGLPQNQTLLSLLAFNVGIEIGQVAVVLMALVLVARFKDQTWYRHRVIFPTSLVIAGVGVFWAVERIV